MKKYISVLLVFIILITGCGNEMKYPELLTPESTLDLYFSVQRGTIKNEKIFNGTIAPHTETVFFGTDGFVGEMNYKLGDEVKAGDVIFTLNDTIDAQLESLEEEIAEHETITEYYETDYNNEIDALNLELESMAGLERELQLIAIDELEIEHEKIIIDRKNAHTILINNYNSLLESKEHSVITAPCDGRIAYLGITQEGDFAYKHNTACVIVDETQNVVQFDYMESSFFETVNDITVQIDGIEYDDVSVLEYTSEELAYNDANDIPNYSRLLVEGLPKTVTCGTYCAVFLTSGTKENVLYVPNESIFFNRQNKEKYCLLMQEDGTQKRINVTTGIDSGVYTEILLGLEEGQSVFYTRNASPLAGDYETTNVYFGDYTHYIDFPSVDSPGVYINTTENMELRADFPCVISEVFLEKNTSIYVEEGTPLFSVSPNVDENDYELLQLQYLDIEEAIVEQTAYYNGLILTKEQETSNASGIAVKAEAELQIKKLEAEKTERIERLQIGLNDLEDTLELYDECINGEEVVITAPISGILNTEFTLVEGKGISYGTLIGHISDINHCVPYISDRMSVLLNGDVVEKDGFLKYGNSVSIISNNNGNMVETEAFVTTAKNILPNDVLKDVSLRLTDINQIANINILNAHVRVKDIEVYNVLLLDSDYIYSDENGFYVLLEYENNAIVRYITTATPLMGNDDAVWVTAGLSEGDVCIKR